MKYLKTYKLFESIIRNPIKDYIWHFIDDYNFKVTLPEIGVCNLSLVSDNYDVVEIVKLYQRTIELIKSDFEVTNHFITLGSNSVHIHIKRKIEDEGEWDFQSEEQKIAYNAVIKCLKEGEKLEPYDFIDGYIEFTKREGLYGEPSWITISDEGYIKLPILRGWRGSNYAELPFTNLDVKWFKRLLEVDDDTDSEEFNLLHTETQEKLRKIYK
jgi:hypothetical protein